MKILNFNDFMKKRSLKDDTMNGTQNKECIIILYTLEIKETFQMVRAFVNIDNGSQGGTHWCCFIIKDNKSYYFDSFGGVPDIFSLNQLLKAIIYHNYEIQDVYSRLCGSYCLYFFLLIERMKYYDASLDVFWLNKGG